MAIDCLPLKTQDTVKQVQAAALVSSCKVCPGSNYSTEHVAITGVQEMGRQGDLGDSSLLAQTSIVSPPQKSYFRKLV